LVEKNILEVFPDDIEIPIPGEKKIEIDLSGVKIWNRKLKRYFLVKPQGLILFPENIGKCRKCGFYRQYCCCQNIERKRKVINQFIKKRLNLLFIRYHRFMYIRLNRKVDKFYYVDREKSNEYEHRTRHHEKYYYYHRLYYELQFNWKEVEFEGIEIKQSKGI